MRSNMNKGVKQFLYTKIIHCRAEENRRNFSCAIIFCIECSINTLQQFSIFAKLCRITLANLAVEDFIREVFDGDTVLFRDFLAGLKKEEAFIVEVVDAFEFLPAVDGPGHGMQGNVELLFNLVEQVE